MFVEMLTLPLDDFEVVLERCRGAVDWIDSIISYHLFPSFDHSCILKNVLNTSSASFSIR